MTGAPMKGNGEGGRAVVEVNKGTTSHENILADIFLYPIIFPAPFVYMGEFLLHLGEVRRNSRLTS